MWNLSGTGAPLAIAIVTIPVVVQHFGKERFGLLTLGLTLVGQVSIFDLGLGRSLTQLVAARMDVDDGELPALVWTSLGIMFCLGVVAAVAVVVLTPWFIDSVLKLNGPIADESAKAFRLLAIALPVVVSTTGLRGVLEAYQRFDLSNAVRIPMAVFTYLAPVVALFFSTSLVLVFGLLAAGRLVAWLAYFGFCLRTISVFQRGVTVHLTAVVTVSKLGGWMAISNFISPLMLYADRFAIGSLLSVAAVSYYAVPYDFVTKLFIVSSAVSGVVFPAFATAAVTDRPRAVAILRAAVKYIFLLLFPCLLVTEALSREGLDLWLGASFADKSSYVLEVVAIGVLLNGLAGIPFALIQGFGRPDLTAKLHLCELPAHVIILLALTAKWGINGAATAWTCRVTVDMVVLYVLAWRLSGVSWSVGSRMAIILAVSLTVLVGFASLTLPILPKLILLSGTLIGFSCLAVFGLLTRQERGFLSLRLLGVRRARADVA